jgi:hypothetical protein
VVGDADGLGVTTIGAIVGEVLDGEVLDGATGT